MAYLADWLMVNVAELAIGIGAKHKMQATMLHVLHSQGKRPREASVSTKADADKKVQIITE